MGNRSGQGKVFLTFLGCLATSLLAAAVYLGGASEGASLASNFQRNITSDLTQRAVKLFLPAAFYEKNQEITAETLALTGISHMLPVYRYRNGVVQTERMKESSLGYYQILAREAADEAYIDEAGNLVSVEEKSMEENAAVKVAVNREKLMDYDYLVQNFYRIDRTTTINSQQLNANELLEKNMQIDLSAAGPQILICHTHSQEGYADSDGSAAMTVTGLGDYLATLLQENYGIGVLHDTGTYDLPDRDNAYSRAEPAIRQILSDHPTIQVVIDLHRDGVPEGTRLVSSVNGKDTARIMFFNGLSRTTAAGDISYLPNPYIQDNLAFSLQMQIAAAENYPGFTRPIYLKGYRYNMHLCPKSLLVEVGAQTNTFQEAKNAMEPLAQLLAQVLLGQ